MVFLVMGRSAENIEKKNKKDRRKTLKNENKVKQRIQGKSNNNEHLWFYLLHTQKNILLKNIVVLLLATWRGGRSRPMSSHVIIRHSFSTDFFGNFTAWSLVP